MNKFVIKKLVIVTLIFFGSGTMSAFDFLAKKIASIKSSLPNAPDIKFSSLFDDFAKNTAETAVKEAAKQKLNDITKTGEPAVSDRPQYGLIAQDRAYPVLKSEQKWKTFSVGTDQGFFEFTDGNEELYDLTVRYKEGTFDLFFRAGTPIEEAVTDQTGAVVKAPSGKASVYQTTLKEADLKIAQNNKKIPLENLSSKPKAYTFNECDAPNQTRPVNKIENPFTIATDGTSLFYRSSPGKDNIHEYNDSLENETCKKIYTKEYSGLVQEATRSSLATIVGDVAKKRIFFGSQYPNLYLLKKDSSFLVRQEIVGNGHLVEVNEGTLIYGRLFSLESKFEEYKRKATNFLLSVGKKIPIVGDKLPAIGVDHDKIHRIGYYAKFFGDQEPTAITDTEDKEDCKMLTSVETVVFGPLLRFYSMVPAAANHDFAAVFLGRSRGMHLSFQSKKGKLFPTVVSWYKLMRWQLFKDGDFTKTNKGEAWDPEIVLPKKLYIVRMKNESDQKEYNHLIIVTGGRVFLMMTPLENVSQNPNTSYSVVMKELFKVEAGTKIDTAALYDDYQTNDGKKLFIVTKQDTEKSMFKHDTPQRGTEYSLVVIDNLAQELDFSNIKGNDDTNFNQKKLRWDPISGTDRRAIKFPEKK
ncbi:hypothetical protein IPH25_00965 [bacterium]|nr:MAG: hypothetical protein IPG37_03085 [bacterium]QQR61997.1 MAG: hypothetical protein IPH25_00965 [bacterium]QQR62410.1 MAG: hypothetical protein IPH67_03190 [bacterium]